MSSGLRRLSIAVPAAAAVLILTAAVSVSSEQLPPSGTYPDFNFGGPETREVTAIRVTLPKTWQTMEFNLRSF